MQCLTVPLYSGVKPPAWRFCPGMQAMAFCPLRQLPPESGVRRQARHTATARSDNVSLWLSRQLWRKRYRRTRGQRRSVLAVHS